MVGTKAVFKYKTIKGPLHKWPALLKLFLLLPLSILCMSLSSLYLGIGIFLAVITAFLCRFSLREQLTDFKPAVFYAMLMYSLSVFSNLFENFSITALIPNHDYLRIALRLTLIVQLSALLFRTTSTLEIKEAVKLNIFSLFLCFIPEIFQTWTNINLTWKARGGRQGVKKLQMLVFVLISICFEKAALKAKALEARSLSTRFVVK
jgi:biotin transport system permease protein/energy-coupling factor transport system permease protein